MTSIVVLINLAGAVALLLFGLAQVKDGMSLAFGPKLRSVLASGTRSSLRSFVSGFVATVALQSSTATALMIAAFVERQLVNPHVAQIVLLGANVGTAVTAWIVASGIAWLSPLAILLGIAFLRSRSTSRQGRGRALIGIGVMLLSLQLLSIATEPMRQSPAFSAFIGLLDNAWPVAFALSAGIALVSSSSLSAVFLILSLAASGIISPALIIVLVLGANLGGAIPPFIATFSAPPAVRRVTLGNLIVRATGCAIALPLVNYGAAVADMFPFPAARLPVDAHLCFNLILAAIAWPLSRPLSQLMQRLVPDEARLENGPKYLDHNELSVPVVALANATRETLGIGDLIDRMLICTSRVFENNDLSVLDEVRSLEKRVDTLQQEVTVYLSKLEHESKDKDHNSRSVEIVGYAVNLEHIGDIIEKGLLPQAVKKASLGLSFSDDGYDELKQIFALTIDNLHIAQTVFSTRNFELAMRMMETKVEVRRMEKNSTERHLERLRDGREDSLQTSSLHLDILRDLKRINAHIASVAHPIIQERGLLVDSRVRVPQ